MMIRDVIEPFISVFDAFDGMEGEGPWAGRPIRFNLSLSGTDPLLVDMIMVDIMGIHPLDVGYLYSLLLLREVKGAVEGFDVEMLWERVIALPFQEARRPFSPHPCYYDQLKW